MKNKLLIAFLFFSTIGFSQQKITWNDLSKVTFKEKYFAGYDDPFLHPIFSSSVKALEGKRVTIKGYFLNIDPNGKLYILSKGPMNACFFCGAGGPETVVELEFATKQKLKTDKIVAVTGVLKLNDTDVERLNYILTKCKVALVK